MLDPSKPRIFISYSRNDGLAFARRLQGLLEAEGFSLYRDLSDLEGGQDWWRQVERAIESVEHVVLVITQAALRSRYVRDEWKLARQEGRSIWPVSGPGEIDVSQVPRWMARANRHDIDIPESRDRLVLGLRAPAQAKRVPFMADPLPPGFVERPQELGDIKRALLDSRGEPVAISAALRGAGGFGKTALANALCHDPEIEEAFSDGVLRVVLGEKPGDLVGRIADLVVMLTGERPDVTHLEAAKTRLAEVLDDRRCLLVIDDAWREQDLTPFLHRGPRDHTTRLITTRDDGVLPGDTIRIAVDAMTSGQAGQMLERDLPAANLPTLRDRLAALAVRLGEWPLLLGLANGVLLARIRRGSSALDALGYVEQSLSRRGLAALAAGNDAERRRTALGSLEVSLEQLGDEERTRYAELAVFVEDAEIPFDAALGLWRQTSGLDPFDGEDLLTRLDALSLLTGLDLGRRSFRLHDVFRSLLRFGRARDRLTELDGRLMAHFRSSCPEGDLARLDDRYGLRHAIAHLRGMGDGAAADRLLLDTAWMRTKLLALGLQPLLADYDSAGSTAASLVAATLRLTAHVLSRRPRELAAQLLARLSPGDAGGLEELLARARASLEPPALVPLRPSFTPPGAELRRFEGHEYGVAWVAVSEDGRRALSVSNESTVRLWDLESGAELRRFASHEPGVAWGTVLADGGRALSISNDGTVRLWDLESGAELRRFDGNKDWVNGVTVLVDRRRALSGCDDGTVRLWDLEVGAELRRFEGHEGSIRSVTVLANGRRALSASHDCTLRLWDLESGVELRRFEGHESWITDVTVFQDGDRALSMSNDGSIRVWDLESGAELRRFEGHGDGVQSLTVLAGGRQALSGLKDGSIRVWDLESGAELRRLEGHGDMVISVAVLGDRRRVLSGSYDGTLRLWDLESGAALRRFEGHEGWINSVTVLREDRRALSGSYDGTLRLWDLESGAELHHSEGHEKRVNSVTVLQDGRRALSGSDDCTLRVWDLESGAELRRFEGHGGWVNSVTMLADGRRALSGSADCTLRLWDLDSGAELRRFEGHGDAVHSVTVLRDGRVLSGANDGTVRLWDLESGAELRCFKDNLDWIRSVTVLGDGRRALSRADDGTLRLWDLENGAELRRCEGHQEWVRSLAVLGDDRRALSGSDDCTVRLWDLESGAELGRYEGHEAKVNSVTVSGDGRRMLSGSDDRTLRLWDLESGVERACMTLDSVPEAIAWSATLGSAVVGDSRGRIHVIRIVD